VLAASIPAELAHGKTAHERIKRHAVQSCIYSVAVARPVPDAHGRRTLRSLLNHMRTLPTSADAKRADTLDRLSILSNWTSGGQNDETLDRSLRTYKQCRFSKELSTRAPVTCTDGRSLIILSRRLSRRSVIFFSAGCPPCGTAGQRHVAVADM
jgi:hypothetical protein